MSEEPIRNLLRRLPREKASAGFTDQVMSRLDETQRPVWARPRLALAGSLVLILGLWIGVGQWRADQDAQVNERIHTLRNEIQQAQKDILLLKDLAPILYLGGDKGVDFVLDLRQLVQEEGNAQPASFEKSDSGAMKGERPR